MDHFIKRRGVVIPYRMVGPGVVVDKTLSFVVPKVTPVISFIRRSIPTDTAEADFVDVRGDNEEISEVLRKINVISINDLDHDCIPVEIRNSLRPVGRGEREQCQGKAKQDFIFCEHIREHIGEGLRVNAAGR